MILVTGESAGIMYAMAAAHPLKCMGSSSRQLSLPEVKLIMRGRMDAIQMQYAYIMAVGEVTTSSDYATAVSQLGLRMGQMQ